MEESVQSQIKNFYDSNSQSWSSARPSSWQGWERFWEVIESGLKAKHTWNILDLGCGNGRLAKWYVEKAKQENKKLDYLGLDISSNLLNIARGQVKEFVDKGIGKFDFQQCDLTDLQKLRKIISGRNKFDILNLIAVMHHIPTQEQRIEIIKLAAEYLQPNGYIAFTLWDFLSNPTMKKLIVKADEDKNDYWLSWQGKKDGQLRFVHLFTNKEKQELMNISGLRFVKDYMADGKNGKLNHYIILQKL